MPYFKKIFFALVFLILIIALIYSYKPVLDSYLDIFFSIYGGLYEFGILAIILTLASLSYCLYITFTQDIKFAAPVALTSLIIPFIFLKPQLAFVIGIGIFSSLAVVYFTLLASLKNYVNFQGANLLAGPIRTLNTLVLLTLTFGFFLHTNSIIAAQGFKIPNALIDWAVNLSLSQAGIPVKGEQYLAQAPTLTQEQINLLKQNPQVLEQYGISRKDLDALAPQQSSQKSLNQNKVNIVPAIPGANIKDIIKAQISNSLDQIIKPYLFAVPAILAFLFYSLVGFCLWLLSIFLNPLIMLIFYILEKTGFIKFDKEMREVKKIVV